MTEKNYKKMCDWFNQDKKRLDIFRFVYKILPCFIVGGYFFVILLELFEGQFERILRVLIVPSITFILCTFMRKIFNRKRPYEVLNITPIINKDKEGQSFPSRHMVSAGVIIVASFYVNNIMGIVMLVVGLMIGIIRPIAGVHFIKDVVVGFLMGIVCGLIGFYII